MNKMQNYNLVWEVKSKFLPHVYFKNFGDESMQSSRIELELEYISCYIVILVLVH